MATPRAAPRKAPPAPEVEQDDDAPAPAKKKSRRWLLIGLVAGVLVLAGGGGAAWYFLAGSAKPTAATDEEKAAAGPAEAPKADPSRKPTFVTLDPFTVNLQNEGADHYLQAGIVIQVADVKVNESLKLYMPVIRNRILMLLSAKVPSELMSTEGKKKLVEEIITATRESVPGLPGESIENAFLSSFVIQ